MGKWRYGVILDAGSSGTRVHIYRWLKYSRAISEASGEELHKLPTIKTKKDWTLKEHPGVSSYVEKLDLIGPEHLKPLFEHALDVVPKDEVQNTPIFLLATAGVRMLQPEQITTMMREICAYARKTTKFQLPDCALHIQAISGETEGLYGWIAANYLLGGFDDPSKHDHGKGHHTYGFLDMGGASAQIAYAPNSTVAETDADYLQTLRLRTLEGNPVEYKVFVTTWLRFGVRESRHRYIEWLLESHGVEKAHELPDPCLPKGLQLSIEGDILVPEPDEEISNLHLVGTGNFMECLNSAKPLLGQERVCDKPPCPMNGVHIPPIDFDVNHFVGVSEYWHTTHEIFEMGHKDKAYDYRTYQDRVISFCSKTWDEIEAGLQHEEWGSKVDEAKAAEVCFKASWLINVLHNGIGIPRVGLESNSTDSHNTTKDVIDNAAQEGYLAPFQAVNKIDHTELSWTLGKMVLYASSEVPPANHSVLPVGFGSNVATGIPEDFQPAGGRPDMPLPTDDIAFTGDDDTDGPDTSDSDDDDGQYNILNSSNVTHRTPGFLLFVVILIVVALLLCGSERRQNIFRKCNPFTKAPRDRLGRSQRSGLFGLGKRRSAKYERVDGTEDIPNPGEFELASYSDSSSSDDLEKGQRRPSTHSSRNSNSSGSGSTTSSLRRTQVGRTARGTPALGLGLHGGVFNQPSTGAANSSRERIESIMGERPSGDSRNGSPARWHPKENVE